MRWREFAAQLEEQPGYRESFQAQFPYANVALAVVALRERHRLTQRALADLVGTAQSVIARLEGGRHPIEIRLLNRIGDAVGEPWSVSFGDSGAPRFDDDIVDTASTDDDPLIAAFNAANTAGDFRAAAEIASRIAADPSTPRRRLALALDTYNRGEHVDAERWSREALEGELPEAPREVATLVLGRALLNLDRSADALAVLESIVPAQHVGWLLDAALAEALLDCRKPAQAQRAAERVLTLTDAPEARYLAARILWHRDKVWEALEHIAVFRAAEPDDYSGLMLHGSILGFIGDKDGDAQAHGSALRLFRQAMKSGDCEALRLYAATAARLGRWEDAFRIAAKLLNPHDGHSLERHQHGVEHVVVSALDHLADDVDRERVANAAEQLLGTSHPIVVSQRALIAALRGDLDGALAALGFGLDELSSAKPSDQMAIAAAFVTNGDNATALKILARNENHLSLPDGMLRLAGTALEVDDRPVARRALRRLATLGGAQGEIADLAFRLLQNLEKADASARITGLTSRASSWDGVTSVRSVPTATGSTWEGRHDPASSVMDRMTRAYVN